MPNVRTRLSRQEFVAVMVELGRAQPHQRAVILKKHHTSDAEIREFVQKYAEYPGALSGTFDTIQARLQRARNRPEAR
ncbi:MAG TPA: hypothetical protein VF021_10075 [Longimicrobiales bacterium]